MLSLSDVSMSIDREENTNRRKFCLGLLGFPAVASGFAMTMREAKAIPLPPLDPISAPLADALWRSTDAVQPEAEPAFLLGRSLHRMRRQAARRRAQRR